MNSTEAPHPELAHFSPKRTVWELDWPWSNLMSWICLRNYRKNTDRCIYIILYKYYIHILYPPHVLLTSTSRKLAKENAKISMKYHAEISAWVSLQLYPLVMTFTVRHGKTTPCYFQNGKASISIRAMA